MSTLFCSFVCVPVDLLHGMIFGAKHQGFAEKPVLLSCPTRWMESEVLPAGISNKEYHLCVIAGITACFRQQATLLESAL